jgi:lipid-binding SYLF domain-containing protein
MMKYFTINRTERILSLLVVGAALLAIAGCSTAPASRDTDSFMSESDAALAWFDRHVDGLDEQIDGAAGYIVFPKVGQFGIIFAGGQFGRGTLNTPDGTQIGWAAINTGSIGLQAGVQGFKMLIVLEDKYALAKFMDNQLDGAVNAVAVAGESGGSTRTPFEDGLAVYQGANSGLMAGVNIGLDYIRYKPLD